MSRLQSLDRHCEHQRLHEVHTVLPQELYDNMLNRGINIAPIMIKIRESGLVANYWSQFKEVQELLCLDYPH